MFVRVVEIVRLPLHTLRNKGPYFSLNMSSKRKWDDEANSAPASGGNDAAAQAGEFRQHVVFHRVLTQYSFSAAIAARIAATMSGANGGAFGSGSPSNAVGLAPKDEKKDQYDGAFTHDIDINDLRNRYLITKGSTQQQVGQSCLCYRWCFAQASLPSDIARNWRISHYQRCLASRQVKGRTQRATFVYSHLGAFSNDPRCSREKGQRSHQPGARAFG